MNNIPGINIINQTSEFIKIPVGEWQWNTGSIFSIILSVLIIIGAVILCSYFTVQKNNVDLFILTLFVSCLLTAGAAKLLINNAYEWQEKEIITYTVTLNETTPFLSLQDYELIKEENGFYFFKTKIKE